MRDARRVTVEHYLRAVPDQPVVVKAQQFARTPKVGVGLFFRGRRDEWLMDEHVKYVQTVWIREQFIVGENVLPFLRRDIVQYAAGMENVEPAVQAEIPDIRSFLQIMVNFASMNCTFAFDRPFRGHLGENRLHFCISSAYRGFCAPLLRGTYLSYHTRCYFALVPVTFVPLLTTLYATISPLQKWNFSVTSPSFTSRQNSGCSLMTPVS